MERDEPHAGGREDSARRREDLIRETFDRWSKGDYEPWTEAIHPQAEVVSQLVNRVYHGYAGIREWAAEVLDSFDEWDAAIAETVEAPGDRLLVIGRVHMRGRGQRRRSGGALCLAVRLPRGTDGADGDLHQQNRGGTRRGRPAIRLSA